jgi:DNA polymerase I-like protein with 3'-5' exonuclease and polymerase domains
LYHLEVLDALLPQLDNLTAATYEFSRALQAPVLEMNTRGVLVDEEERWRVVAGYRKQIEFLQGQLYTILKEGLGVDINWRSSQQLKHLFYEVLGYAPIKKKGKITVDRDALEKLQLQFLARPIIAHILLLRDIAKKEGFLRTEIDSDGRIRTSFNIAGTNTGRFSSPVFQSLAPGQIYKTWRISFAGYLWLIRVTNLHTLISNRLSRAP